MNIVFAALCLFVIGRVLLEGFEMFVLPRRVSRPLRFSTGVSVLFWKLWRTIAPRLERTRRDDFLAAFGPLMQLLLFALWAGLLVLAFAGLLFALHVPIQCPEGRPTAGTYIYLSATTFITLGYGDVSPRTELGRLFCDIEAGLGFGVLAITIAYLPVLYTAFSRREIEIGLLDARASTPPSAGELLARLDDAACVQTLAGWLRDWERWSAELLESHLSYPGLMAWRSQHDRQSWLAALTVVLDTSALVAVSAPPESGLRAGARRTFAMARHAAVDLCLTQGQPPLPLERTGVDALFARLAQSPVAWDRSESVRERLAELRGLYEPYVQALSAWLLLPLPALAIDPTASDNWRTSKDPDDHFFSLMESR